MKENWNAIVGNRIRERRKERGVLQIDFARRLEINVQTLRNYEGGLSCPPSHTLYLIARELSCDMGYFYGPIRSANAVKF